MVVKVRGSAIAGGDAGFVFNSISSYLDPPAGRGAPLSPSDLALIVTIVATVVIFFLIVIAVLLTVQARDRARARQVLRRPSVIVDRQADVEPLVNALRSSDWEARNEVVSALGNIGGETVVDPLINVLLNDGNAKVRENAARWLGLIGNEKAVAPLVRVVKNYLAGSDTAANVAVSSAAALGDIGSPEGLAVVKRLAAAQGQGVGSEDIKRVGHAIKDIELTKDLTTKKCIVCNLPLGNEEQLVECPFCRNVAHKDHMHDWLRARDCCPACRATISEFSLITVQPKRANNRTKRTYTRPKPRRQKD